MGFCHSIEGHKGNLAVRNNLVQSTIEGSSFFGFLLHLHWLLQQLSTKKLTLNSKKKLDGKIKIKQTINFSLLILFK